MSIKPKQKTCKKGTGRAKGYEGCGNEDYLRNGLCRRCYPKWYFSTEEGQRRTIEQARKKIEKDKKEQDAEKKIESKSIRVLIIEAKEPFQKLIRIRDHRKSCICCDNILPYNIGDYDAGHFKKAEIYSGLIFHPDNCHGQRVYCNKHLYGNESSYAEGLKKRIGIERYENIVELSVKFKKYDWDRHRLIELKKHYKSELKAVESGKKDISNVDFSIGIVK